MKLLGIDEAGRGCVIGPLIICGAEAKKDNVLFNKIKDLLRDSKKLAKKRRKQIYNLLIKANIKIYIEIIHADELNREMKSISLNAIEEKHILKICSLSNAEKIYIDCFSSKKDFEKSFLKKINSKADFFIEFKADENYKIVSAASIIAKIKRDEYIEKINKKYKKIGFVVGSGYPSDKTTIQFIKEYFKKFKKLPCEARTKWKTIKNITTLLNYAE